MRKTIRRYFPYGKKMPTRTCRFAGYRAGPLRRSSSSPNTLAWGFPARQRIHSARRRKQPHSAQDHPSGIGREHVILPKAKSTAASCDIRLTSNPAVGNAPISVVEQILVASQKADIGQTHSWANRNGQCAFASHERGPTILRWKP